MAERELFPALRRLFGPSPVEKKGLADRVRASSRSYVTPGQPYSNTWNVDRAVREAYEGNPLVYRAIEVICQNAIAQRMILRKGDPDEGSVIDTAKDPSRLLYVLNRRANPWETALIFRHRFVAQYLLSSRGVFIEVILARSGRIGMLNILDPDLVDIVPSEKRNPQTNEVLSADPIGVFRVRVPGGGYDELPRFDPEADDQPSSVLWVRSPHPTVMWAGMSPVQAAGMSIDLDKYARIYNRRFLQNDGRPGGLLSVKGNASRETMERIQAQFTGGVESAGRTTVISADAVSYADTSGSPRDLMWGELSKMTKSEIALAFGVPESVMGDASGRCVDMETEALTQRGWLRGDEITTEDIILSMDPADGCLKWSPVHEVYRAHYRGDMYRLRHAHADFLVTPGHNWAVETRRRDQQQGVKTPYLLRKVENLSTHDRIRTIGEAEAGAAEPVYSNAFVELVGWAVTEGYFFPNKNSEKSTLSKTAPYVRIRQNSGELADRIVACAKESGARLNVHERDGRVLVNVRGEIAAALHQVAPGKIMSTEFLLALTAEQRHLLMWTMLDADGCTNVPNTASWTFAQKDRRATEAFVFLATLCGYTTSVREREFTYRHKGAERPARDWLAVIRRRKVMTIQRDTRTVEDFDGRVWCPRTDYGTFVARRHGKVVLTGNTFDNADAEYAMFWEHRMLPLLREIDDQLDILTGGYDDDLYLRHDLSKIWVLGRHKREMQRTAREDVGLGLRTINEYREIAELDPVPGDFANVLMVPGGKIIGTDDQELAERVAELPMLGTPAPADPGVEAEQGAEIGSVAGATIANNNVSASRLRLVAGEDRAPVAIEGRKALELEGKQGGAREEAGAVPGPTVWG